MNHTYRIVFNHQLGIYQCVSEFAKAQGKGKGFKIAKANKAKALVASMAMVASGQAMAEHKLTQNQRIIDGESHTFNSSVNISAANSGGYGYVDIHLHNGKIIMNDPNGQLIIGKGNSGNLLAQPRRSSSDRPAVISKGDILIGVKDPTKAQTEDAHSGALQVIDGDFSAEKDVILGDEGANSELKLFNIGKSVIGGELVVGNRGEEKSEVNVRSSELTINKKLTVGKDGSHSHNAFGVHSQSVVDVPSVIAGENEGSVGKIDVGSSSQLNVAGDVELGRHGKGSLSVGVQSTANIPNGIKLSTGKNGSGEVSVWEGAALNTPNIIDEDVSNSKVSVGPGGKINVPGRILASALDVNGVVYNPWGSSVHKDKDKDTEIKAAQDIITNQIDVKSGNIETKQLTIGQFAGRTTNSKIGSKGRVVADDITIAKSEQTINRFRLSGGGELTAHNQLVIGDKGVVQIEMAADKIAAKNITIAKQDTGDKERESYIKLDDPMTEDGRHGSVVATENLVVSQDGKGYIEVFRKGLVSAGKDIIIGKQGAIKGGIDTNITAGNRLVVNSQRTDENHLDLDGSTLTTKDLVLGGDVGMSSQHTLSARNTTIHTQNIAKAPSGSMVRAAFDNSIINIAQQPTHKLFRDFKASDDLQFSNAFTINTNEHHVAIDDGVSIKAKADTKATFVKKGTGTLTMPSSARDTWRGVKTEIDNGMLKIAGNHTMHADDVLAVTLHDAQNYGKLHVTGTANIANGKLKVKASDIVKDLTSGNNPKGEWKDVLVAGTLNGQFAKNNFSVVDKDGNAIDNSPIRMDYADANKMHLTVRAKSNPTPSNPPATTTPTNPSTGSGSGSTTPSNPSAGTTPTNPSTGSGTGSTTPSTPKPPANAGSTNPAPIPPSSKVANITGKHIIDNGDVYKKDSVNVSGESAEVVIKHGTLIADDVNGELNVGRMGRITTLPNKNNAITAKGNMNIGTKGLRVAHTGDVIPSDGEVRLDNSRLDVGKNLTIGDYLGRGTLVLKNKSEAKVGGNVVLNEDKEYPNGGTIQLDNSKITIEKDLVTYGNGFYNSYISLANQSQAVVKGKTIIGDDNASNNEINVDNSQLDLQDTLTVGHTLSNGRLNVVNGATANTKDVYVARFNDKSSGTMTVDGENSRLNVNGKMELGYEGNATLAVSDKAEAHVTGDITMGAGQLGVGGALVDKQAKLIAKNIIVGDKSKRLNELKVLENSQVLAQNDVVVGNDGLGVINVEKSQLTAKSIVVGKNSMPTSSAEQDNSLSLRWDAQVNADEVVIGESAQSAGTITVGNGDSKLAVKNTLVVGKEGSASFLGDSNSQVVAHDIIMGQKAGSSASVGLITHAGMIAKNNIIIGQEGAADVELNTYLGGSRPIKAPFIQADNDIVIGKHGTMAVNESDVIAKNNFVINSEYDKGHQVGLHDGILRAKTIKLGGVIRDNRTLSAGRSTLDVQDIVKDNGRVGVRFEDSTINITDKPTQDLFKDFTPNDNFEAKGNFTINTNEHDVKLADGVNIGYLDKGTFVKKGTGTLTMPSSARDTWRGVKTEIDNGMLKIAGNHTMHADDVLAVTLHDTQNYGKLHVTGTANIANGKLKVKASDIVKDLTSGNNPKGEWKDVLVAGTLNGQFAKNNFSVVDKDGNAIDNSPIRMDYADANKMHLTVRAKSNPTPSNPPATTTPTNPSTGSGTGSGSGSTTPTNPSAGTGSGSGSTTPSNPSAGTTPTNPSTGSGTGSTTPSTPKPPAGSGSGSTTPSNPSAGTTPTNPSTGSGTGSTTPSTPKPPAGSGSTTPSNPSAGTTPTNPSTGSGSGSGTGSGGSSGGSATTPTPMPPGGSGLGGSSGGSSGSGSTTTPPPSTGSSSGSSGSSSGSSGSATTPAVPSPSPKPTGFFRRASGWEDRNVSRLGQKLDHIVSHTNSQNELLSAALQLGSANMDEATVMAGVRELQPLLAGSTNKVVSDNLDQTIAAIYDSHANRSNHLWAKAVGGVATQTPKDNAFGYQNTQKGVVVGGDVVLDDVFSRTQMGLALSHINNGVVSRGNDVLHEATAKTTQATAYGVYQVDAGSLFGHVGLGRSKIAGTRHIKTFADTTANSDYHANTLQAGLGVSHRFGTEDDHITPFASVDYRRVSANAHRETGAGVYNLDVHKATHGNVRTTLGVKLQHQLNDDFGVKGMLAAAKDSSDKNNRTFANFADVPDSVFDVSRQGTGSLTGLLGVGADYRLGQNTQLVLDYQGQWRNNHSQHGGTAGVKMVF